MVAAIVAVDNNWGIGKNNNLLVDIPADKKFFKEKTLNSIVVMGRKTWDSLPIKPLPNRLNYVVSNNLSGDYDKETMFISLEEAVKLIKCFSQEKDIFVIGGGQIYRELLPFCDTVYVTKIYEDYDADVFFPNIDSMKEWDIENCSEVIRLDQYPPYQLFTYKKIGYE